MGRGSRASTMAAAGDLGLKNRAMLMRCRSKVPGLWPSTIRYTNRRRKVVIADYFCCPSPLDSLLKANRMRRHQEDIIIRQLLARLAASCLGCAYGGEAIPHQSTYSHYDLDSILMKRLAPCSAGAGWLGWPAPSQGHCSNEPASSTFLSHKRTSNNTNQPTEQAVETQAWPCRAILDLASSFHVAHVMASLHLKTIYLCANI